MKYEIRLRLGQEWTSSCGLLNDGSGEETYHIEATRADGSFIDISFGNMPDGETAQDQAFANFVDSVGFSDEDPEGYNPIACIKFNGKNAWGFDAYCENDAPMRLLAQEVKSGMLAVIVFSAPDRDSLVDLHLLIEHNLRVQASKAQ